MAFSGLKNFLGIKSEEVKRAQEFEESPTDERFKFVSVVEMQHIGVPVNCTNSLTYDRVQGLVATGTMEGTAKM